MPSISVQDASVQFDLGRRKEPVLALSRVDLEIPERKFICLLGPSGCGKSTLLNTIAGFLEPSEGSVLVDDVAVQGPDPSRGVVFQDANLFPWLSVYSNVAFGLSVRGIPKSEAKSKVDEVLERVGLSSFSRSLPQELSGGMRQRVALARVLVNDPPVMLMDEPFGALDAQTRIIMQELLLELWEKDRKTVVFVTHDIDEALLLADRIYVMSIRPGRIKNYMDVDIERPRNYSVTNQDSFRALRQELFDQLHDEAMAAEQLTA
ncbi:MAG: ABC transporter ATP-binding protein [Propionibacteriaceae bacterium]